IRVRIERSCDEDPIEHCRRLLEKLGITKTKHRTGILIYCSLEDRKVAIYGDSAIHAVIGNEGWKQACEQLRVRFAKGDFANAICDAIQTLMPVLAEHFPAYKI